MQPYLVRKLLLTRRHCYRELRAVQHLDLAVAIKASAAALPGIVALAGDGDRSGFRERTLGSFYIGGHWPFRIIMAIYIE